MGEMSARTKGAFLDDLGSFPSFLACFDCVADCVKYGIGVMQHVGVPKADDSVACVGKFAAPVLVGAAVYIML